MTDHLARPITKSELESALSSGIAREIAAAVLAVTEHDPDLEFAQQLCLRQSADRHSQVRVACLAGLGNLARRFGRLDQNKVEPLVQWSLLDDDPAIREEAEAAANAIDRYTGWRVSRSGKQADA